MSSLTLTKESTTTKQKITVKDENAVMGLVYVKFSVDDEAIAKVVDENSDAIKELSEFIAVEKIETTHPAKVTINTKRAVNNNN